MKLLLPDRCAVVVAYAIVLIAIARSAAAGGFAIIEQSATAAGNAVAGQAAAAEDASTVFYNPAGMTRLGGLQSVGAVGFIVPDLDYSDRGSTDAVGGPMRGNLKVDNDIAIVPNGYVSWQVSDRFWLGFGLASPFGNANRYSDDWVGRYQSIETELLTINMNPSGAVKITEWLSLGAGFNAQYARTKRKNAIDFGSICFGVPGLGPEMCPALGLTPQNADGSLKVDVDDWGFGYNLGILLEPVPGSRIGIAYRSKIELDSSGDAKFNVPAAAQILTMGGAFQNTGITSAFTLPETASLSYYQDIGKEWALLADVTWTRWSRFKTLVATFDNPAQPPLVLPQNWNDTFRYAVAVNYSPFDSLKLRAGFAYDESPIPSRFRTSDTPFDDRITLAIGAGYDFSEMYHFDLSYSYTRDKDASIDETANSASGTLLGNYRPQAHAFGGQISVRF